jgi:serine protease AprX
LGAAAGGLAIIVALAGVLAAGTSASAAPGRDGGADARGRPAERAAGSANTTGKHPAAWRFDASAASMADVNRVIGADRLRRTGLDGAGVGVALLDTGVVPVDGLRGTRVVNGPDLSFDGPVGHLRHRDTYGHGTHLAGIIAGTPATDGGGFGGVAPGATLTSVKVGAGAGVVDVSQVIAAIDWVVAHRDDDPRRPIRVLNLSYGTDGVQDYRVDPLTHAVENAWRAGIVVVVAAGNGGTTAPQLANPAYDPYVLAVGAADPNGTTRVNDDTVTDFSSRGDAARRVDLVAPGQSIVSLRNPGGYVDETYPQARVGGLYTKGSGTSQAAAVVSGAVALLLQQRPDLRPDEVKALLTGTATALPAADEAGLGAGELDVFRAARAAGRSGDPAGDRQRWARSTGLGSLEAARGSAHVALDGVALTGERDLFGPFDAAAWARASSAGTAWEGGHWLGRPWTGAGWTALSTSDPSWSDFSWSGLSWSGLSWSGLSWSGLSWSGLSWSGLSWSGLSWSGLSWSGLSWSGLSWSGLSWSGLSWSGLSWSDGVWG